MITTKEITISKETRTVKSATTGDNTLVVVPEYKLVIPTEIAVEGLSSEACTKLQAAIEEWVKAQASRLALHKLQEEGVFSRISLEEAILCNLRKKTTDNDLLSQVKAELVKVSDRQAEILDLMSSGEVTPELCLEAKQLKEEKTTLQLREEELTQKIKKSADAKADSRKRNDILRGELATLQAIPAPSEEELARIEEIQKELLKK
jgi:hypothetical protein